MTDQGHFAVPHSITKQRWTSLDRYFTKIFTDSFCHDNHFALKVNTITTKAGSLRFRERLNWRDDRLFSLSELRMWFPVDSYNTLYTKLTNDQFKLHVDFGVGRLSGYRFNTYATFHMNRKGQQKKFAVGVQNLSEHCHSDTRLRIDEYKVACRSIQNVELGNRTHIRHGAWNVGLLGIFNVIDAAFLKKEFYVGYLKNKWEVHARANQAWNKPTVDWKDPTQWFNQLSLIGVYRRNEQERYGVEVDFNPASKTVGDITGIVEFQQNPSNGLKIKLNDKMNASFVLKHVVSNQLTVALGASIAMGSTVRHASKVGLQVDLNI